MISMGCRPIHSLTHSLHPSAFHLHHEEPRDFTMDTDVRVRLRFVTKDEAIRVSDAPLAVPVQLNRRGLSEVVNHLRTASAGDVGGLYDFVIDDQLVRCSLDKFLRATGISTVRENELLCWAGVLFFNGHDPQARPRLTHTPACAVTTFSIPTTGSDRDG